MKKSNAKLWITIGIIAVVLVIGIIYFANFMMVKDSSRWLQFKRLRSR